MAASASRRVVTIAAITAAVAAVPFLVASWRTAQATRDAIGDGRLDVARAMAAQADRLVAQIFHEVDLVSATVPGAGFGVGGGHDSSSPFGAVSPTTAGVVLLDDAGTVVSTAPARLLADPDDAAAVAPALAASAGHGERSVSLPFMFPASGHAMVAVGVPVFDASGARGGTVVGLADLTEPLITELVQPALALGATGHADLVDDRGMVVASTNPAHLLGPGDHPDFYRRMAEQRRPTVDTVEHRPEPDAPDQSTSHLMAYAPLRNAPWGIAIGSSATESLGRVHRQQREMVALAFASIAVLALGTALMVRSGRAAESGDTA